MHPPKPARVPQEKKTYRHMKTTIPTHAVTALGLAATMLGGMGCQNDGEAWEAYEEQLCEMTTDANGQPCKVVLDDGTCAQATQQAEGLTPDSTYRALALFSRSAGETSIHVLKSIIAPKAKPNISPESGTDGVKPLACWRSRDYVNLRIAVERSQAGTHSIGFAHDGICQNGDATGTKTLKLRLLHDAGNDRKDFFQEILTSCPTYPFKNLLQSGKDSIRMTVHTDAGERTFTFPF